MTGSENSRYSHSMDEKLEDEWGPGWTNNNDVQVMNLSPWDRLVFSHRITLYDKTRFASQILDGKDPIDSLDGKMRKGEVQGLIRVDEV